MILGIELWQMHAFMMTLSLIFFIFGFVSLYLKKKKWWFNGHKFLECIAVFFAVGGLLIAIYMVEKAGGTHFNISHAYLGLLSLILLVITLGVTPFRKNRNVRRFHILIGLAGFLSVILTIIYGLALVQ